MRQLAGAKAREREAKPAAGVRPAAGRRQFDGDRIKAALQKREDEIVQKWRERP